jgi:hypothetical protein
MGKKKTENPELLLTHNIIVRVTEDDYNKYEQLCGKSDCTSVAEVVRRILAGRQVILFHKDAAMDGPMEILTGIQKELKAIGNNINQITRAYNSSRVESQQIYQAQKALQEYQKVEAKVSLLLSVISQLSKQWLQK